MADNKPKLIRGKGRPGFKMTKPAGLPQLQKQSWEARIASKTERDVAKLKKTQEAGRTRIRAAASQKQAKAVKVTGERFREAMQKTAAKKTGTALVEYKKPTAPTPTPDKPAAGPKRPGAVRRFAGLHKQGGSFAGAIGKSPAGRLMTGQTGRNIITRAAGKGLLRKAAAWGAGNVLRIAGPLGVGRGAVEGTRDIIKAGKRIHQRVIKPKIAERRLRIRSEEKYGTLEKAARTRKAMTGK